MNTFQVRAFVSYVKKQKEISNEKRKMASDYIVNGDNTINRGNNLNNVSKESGDKRIRINR